jgi:hypothetical protein
MPAPTTLQFGTDQATCDKARLGLPGTGTPADLCNILPHPYAGIFYWTWRGNGAHPTAVGFRVYRTDGGRHDLVHETHFASPPPIEGTTALFSGGLAGGACYSVTAFDQSAESVATPQLCINERWAQVLPTPGALPRFVSPSPAPLGATVAPMAATPLPAPYRPFAITQADMRTQCADHGGPAGIAACQAALAKGGLAIGWGYQPAHIDGFHVYTVARTREQPAARTAAVAASTTPTAPVATQTTRLATGQVSTMAVLDPRPAGFANACFVVTAYVGALESEASAPYCVAP